MQLRLTINVEYPADTKETLALRKETADRVIAAITNNVAHSSATNPYKAERAPRKAKNNGEAPANPG